MSPDGFVIDAAPAAWGEQLAGIAERLGVLPLAHDEPDAFLVADPGDGRRYDLGAILVALLDRLDAAASGEDSHPSIGTAA